MPNPPAQRFEGVPDGSTLQISVAGEKPTFGASGFLLFGGAPTLWHDSDLVPGPVTHVLKKNMTYAVAVDISFTSATTVTITGKIVKKGDNGIHSVPKTFVVKGKKDQVITSMAFIETERTDG